MIRAAQQALQHVEETAGHRGAAQQQKQLLLKPWSPVAAASVSTLD
jgi:hypothetical protein